MTTPKTIAFGIREVISEGFCIGCGSCTTQSAATKIEFNQFGELVANISGASEKEIASMDKVCPFSSTAKNETELSEIAFKSEKDVRFGDEIGAFTGLYAGYSETHRKWGSSGGIVSWMLSELLSTGVVDKVLVVGKNNEGDRFFDFKVVADSIELQTTGTSFYYPVSFDGALKYILENPGRYAITGVPCFHKALRQLKEINPLIAERVTIQIGIVCGQMKSAFYLEYLDRKAGKTAPLVNACFRRKDESSRADDYLFEGTYINATNQVETRSVRNSEIGSNWAMGLFKPRACDFCDDVFAETADISVMDAWLDQYVQDGKGTSLIVTRTNLLKKLLETGKTNNALELNAVSEKDIVESQRGGLNHRRAGLRYRLLQDVKKGPVPKKRVKPSSQLDIWFKAEQRIRSKIRERSRHAMRKQLSVGADGLNIYTREMNGILALYKWFLRVKRRASGRHVYSSLFKLDV
jgi:coenzyme F420 hydrogenase subunit beta